MRRCVALWVLVVSVWTFAAPYVWIEGEDFAASNFPYGSAATRGVFCRGCSGGEFFLFRPGARGRPFFPPGYWYARWAFRVLEPGDYRFVWIAYGPEEAEFSWTVDEKETVPARVVRYGGNYGFGRARFRWAQLDPRGMDLTLSPEGNPHTFAIRRDDPGAGPMWIDAILLTTDRDFVPTGPEGPTMDRSTLVVFPDYVALAVDYLEHLLPETLPNADAMAKKLWTFATPGEYEPLSFAIHARRSLSRVRVEISPLRCGTYEIPRNALDLRVVQVMEKRRHARAGPDETELVPEILNYNSPQDIPAGTSRQWWLIIHVPREAPPGTYRGRIVVEPENAPQQEITVELVVLPFVLSSPRKDYSLAYSPLRVFAGRELTGDPLVYMRQDYADMRAHGITSPSLYIPLTVSRGSDGEVRIDYGEFIAAMDLIAELGFPGPVHWRGVSRLWRDLRRWGLSEEEAERTYVEAVRSVLELRRERSWPEIYFFPVDEPFGHPEKEAEFYRLAPLIKRVPGAMVEVSLNGVIELPSEAEPFVDLRSYNGWTVDLFLPQYPFAQLAALIEAAGDRAWVYYNVRGLGGRPEFSRAAAGFYLWASPFAGLAAWTYHVFFGDPYDAADGPRGDFAYAYPDPEKNFAPTLPTLRWEGFREGVDDMRYLTTLEEAIAASRDNPGKREAVAQARALLKELRGQLEHYGPELRGILAYMEPNDYQAWRWRIAQAILDLMD